MSVFNFAKAGQNAFTGFDDFLFQYSLFQEKVWAKPGNQWARQCLQVDILQTGVDVVDDTNTVTGSCWTQGLNRNTVHKIYF